MGMHLKKEKKGRNGVKLEGGSWGEGGGVGDGGASSSTPGYKPKCLYSVLPN